MQKIFLKKLNINAQVSCMLKLIKHTLKIKSLIAKQYGDIIVLLTRSWLILVSNIALT